MHSYSGEVLPVILIIQKRHVVLSGIFVCLMIVLTAVLLRGHTLVSTVFSVQNTEPVTLVIDPGHGGEDGGAVSTDGAIAESGLNLEISKRVGDLLSFTGQRWIMTRTEDISIHTGDATTAREKKISDIHHRVAIVQETEDAVLLSIHQNSLPSSPVTHGAQVFWNDQSHAEFLADTLQDALNLSVNVGNEKNSRKISPTIYLMSHIGVPGILVECGFLSNRDETVRLQEAPYQKRLAAAIVAGISDGLSAKGVP